MSTSLAHAVLIALVANLLSVSALRCHQCNSHENKDCANLLVNTPRAQRDNQYLTDCATKDEQPAFCRKTVIKFEVNEEHRIERSCGWIEEKSHNACFTADNEGYKQVICTCSEEGCNGATSILGARQVGYSLMATILSLVIANVMNH